MFAWVKYITYIPTLVVLIQAAVAFIEALKKEAPGPEKKQDVMNALEASWDSFFPKKVDAFDAVKPVISYLIDLCVSVYNAVGYFTKKEAEAPTEA